MQYGKPQVVRFGTFRQLTQQNGKKDAGTDLASAFGCETHAQEGSHASCMPAGSARG